MVRAVIHHLSLIPEIGPIAIKQIGSALASQGGDWQDLYHYTSHDFERIGIAPRLALLLQKGLANRSIVEREQQLIARHGLSLLAITDADYPPLLRVIHAPPPLLYIRGALSVLARTSLVALVGSRDANTYGLDAAAHLVAELVPAGWSTVSGGARGIDAVVHQATLRAQGITVVVLGSGLLRPYPREHGALFDAIVQQGGAVVSSYPLETVAAPGNFPARNRIIAGLARGCVVVQAAEKSGALITATYALNEGREVGVVPGSIFDPLSTGCHALLSQGATPITSGRALLTMLGAAPADAVVNSPVAVPMYQNTVQGYQDTLQSGTKISRAVTAEKSMSAVQLVPEDPHTVLLHACAKGATFDDLLVVAKRDSEELTQLLWELQIQGKIEQTLQGNWRSVRLY